MINKDILIAESTFLFSRSSGPGGQNVNKVNTKVELRFHVDNSNHLSAQDKELIHKRLKTRINNSGELVLIAQNSRSQISNKLIVCERFISMLESALKPVKKRRPTKPGKGAKEKRLKLKKIRSDLKKIRKRPID